MDADGQDVEDTGGRLDGSCRRSCCQGNRLSSFPASLSVSFLAHACEEVNHRQPGRQTRSATDCIRDLIIIAFSFPLARLGRLAAGLRGEFNGHARGLMVVLLEKLKDKNRTVLDAVHTTLHLFLLVILIFTYSFYFARVSFCHDDEAMNTSDNVRRRAISTSAPHCTRSPITSSQR